MSERASAHRCGVHHNFMNVAKFCTVCMNVSFDLTRHCDNRQEKCYPQGEQVVFYHHFGMWMAACILWSKSANLGLC